MSFFIDNNDEITVVVHSCKNSKNKTVYWTKNIIEKKPNDTDASSANVTTNTLKFRLPTYKDNMDIMDSAISMGVDGKFSFSASKLAFNRFSTLLKSWDFVDEKNQVITISDQNIHKMDNNLAQVIMRDLEMQIAD